MKREVVFFGLFLFLVLGIGLIVLSIKLLASGRLLDGSFVLLLCVVPLRTAYACQKELRLPRGDSRNGSGSQPTKIG